MNARILGVVVGVTLLVTAEFAHAEAPQRWNMVTVQAGDTLSEIAKREHIALHELVRLNGITNPDFIRVGQELKTHPAPMRTSATTPQRQSRRSSEDTLWLTHRVRPGDTLWEIGKKYNVKTRYLMRNNNVRGTGIIQPGNEIRVKKRLNPLLVDGVQLPEGKGYVRLRPKKAWGTAGTVRLIQHAYKQFAVQYPNSVPGYVADLSKEHGGHLRPHRSHQRGIDADISYFKKNNTPTHGLEVVTPDSIDITKTWDLIRHFLNTQHIPAIFMDYTLQRTLHDHLVRIGYDEALRSKILQYPRSIETRKGIIRHSPGHHHHLHVRFDCLKPADRCDIPETTWIGAMVLPVPIDLAPPARANRRHRRAVLELAPSPIESIARKEDTAQEASAQEKTMTKDTMTKDTLTKRVSLRIVRPQEPESRRAPPTALSMLERHWLEFLRNKQGGHGLATETPPKPLGSRTEERPSRSERFGPTSQANEPSSHIIH